MSLDWILYEVDKGPDILRFVKRSAPLVATLVSTRFSEKRLQAFKYGADLFRVRNGDDRLVEDVARTIRLTYRRRIAARITAASPSQIPVFDFLKELKSEKELLDCTRRLLFNTFVSTGTYDDDLRRLLIQRGWWRPFYPNYHARLSLVEKVQHLASYAHLDPGVLTAAMEPSATDGTAAAGGYGSIEKLLAVLGYGLRLVQYEAEFLPLLFADGKAFQGIGMRAPWDSLGLNEYLLRLGAVGIDEAHHWLLEV